MKDWNWEAIFYGHYRSVFNHFGVVAAYCSNFGHCVFEPPFGGLKTTYNVHIGLIGKRVVDFIVLTELFSLGVTVEALRAKKIENYAK